MNLLMLILVWGVNVSAATSPTVAMLESFLNCRSQPTREKAHACTAKFFAPDAEAWRVERISNWLLLPLKITHVRDCRSEEMSEHKGFSGRTDHAVCFQIASEGVQVRPAILYFRWMNSRFYVHSMFY